jgi:uncharacterized SAM-binding protein YcdF (DUF218 family)
VVVLLCLGASRLGVWESLLVSLGRWLVVETPLRETDLVVALGGGRGRQVMAAKLLQQGLARQILFTGADVQPNDYQCLGVTVGQVMALPVLAYTTYEEAVALRQIVQAHSLGSVLIVTSSHHARRAYWTFEQVLSGTGVELLIAVIPDAASTMETWWKSHTGRKQVLSEYMGLAYYWLQLRMGGWPQ